MEGAPSNHESESENSDSEHKRKKRASRPAGLEPTAETAVFTPANPEYDSLWRRLLKDESDKAKDDETERSESVEADTSDVDDNDARLADLELGELPDEQAVTELAPDETAVILECLAAVRRQALSAEQGTDDAVADPETAAAMAYLELVAHQHELPDDAAAAVGQELYNEPEQSVSGPQPPINDGGSGRPSNPDFYGGRPLEPNRQPGSGSSRAESVSTEEQPPGYSKSDMVGTMLVGGIVGYLIGRRRGRIKTEKRLRPVQKKLEKQVKGLQENLERQEFNIRRLAAETAGRPLSVAAEALRERVIAGPVRLPERERQSITNTIPERRQIGHVLTTAETAASVVAAETARVTSLDKHVETLKPKDLLELSAKIIVEGTSLRQLYETHRISERALRRVVSEHLRGGSTRGVLRQEMTQHEIDFERDPQLRDQGRRQSGDTGQSTTALDGLLRRADDVLGLRADTDRWSTMPGSQTDEHRAKAQQQRVLQVSLMGIILVLLLLALYLAISPRSL